MTDIFTVFMWVALIGVGIWLTIRMRNARKSQKPRNDPAARQERAVWAWAKVLNSTSQPSAAGWTRVTMELEVHAPGSEPCSAEATWLVDHDSLGYVETGQEISLKADPQDPHYVYPNGPWAKMIE